MAEMTQKKKSLLSRQAILVIVFALLVLGGGGYYYYTTFTPQEVESVVELGTKRQLKIRRVNWQQTVYDHTVLQKLKNPLAAPLDVGTVGNKHPFRAPVAQ